MKVFLSYATDDTDVARRIADRLWQERFDVWDAAQELLPGDNVQAVAAALESAHAMVVVLSPASAKSTFVQSEIEYALQSEAYAGRLFPVMVTPTQGYPWILRELGMVDVSKARAAGDDEAAPDAVVAALAPLVPRLAGRGTSGLASC